MAQSCSRSYVRSIPITQEKDFLDPEAAFNTALHTTTFRCDKEEENNVEVLFENEDPVVTTSSCTGQQTKHDVYRLQSCQRIVYFEMNSTDYLPTSNHYINQQPQGFYHVAR
jgi:hypothetical protein